MVLHIINCKDNNSIFELSFERIFEMSFVGK